MWMRFAPAILGLAACGAGSSAPPIDATEPDAALDAPPPTGPFSFFVTSLVALRDLSGNPNGFGGDLRYGETGPGAGLRGADKLCRTIAERSLAGSGAYTWRAFLSAASGETGQQVDAIDRIGNGPWYDRTGRLFAPTKADLLFLRPRHGTLELADDFPNEDGVPNHRPDPLADAVDNHDMLTGTDDQGRLYAAASTCLDWTAAAGDIPTEGRPRVGHSWPRPLDFVHGGPLSSWMSSLDESGCAPGINLVDDGPPDYSKTTVGSGGGYGGFYCFASIP